MIQIDIPGYNHIAISTGSIGKVDEITQKLKNDGYILLNAPRTTGDGYYESVFKDPDGNKLEITVEPLKSIVNIE